MKWAHYLYIFRVTAALHAIKLQRIFAMQHYDTSKAPTMKVITKYLIQFKNTFHEQ